MGLREDMLNALTARGEPLCDDCVWQLCGMTSRQQANSRGRELEAKGLIRRGQGSCSECKGIKTVSVPTGIELPVQEVEHDTAKPWHWEGNVQAALVAHLKSQGWRLLSQANTATKESGVDVKTLDPEGHEWWITVKGYPERKPDKTTNPSTQARHWFSHAMFDVVLYRTEQPGIRIGVAIPGPYQTYDSLSERVTWLRESAPFALFVVHEDGTVTMD